MGAWPLNLNQFILILFSILDATLIFHPNLLKVYGTKCIVERRKLMFSAFQFSIINCSALLHPCVSVTTRSTRNDIIFSSDTGNPLASTPRPFALSTPPTYGQPLSHLPRVHSGPSTVHQCQPQQYQPYPAYLDSYMSASPYPNFPRPSAFPHYRETERLPHDHERRTYTPTEPRADDHTEPRDHRYAMPTESRKRQFL